MGAHVRQANPMSTTHVDTESVIGLEQSGMLLTPEEFDAIDEFDENYRYELIHGVLVVNPIPSAEETGPNELLGFLLWKFHEDNPGRSTLSDSLPQQYVRAPSGRRIADRLIWVGLGRVADLKRDPATIAVEFVSSGKRSRTRDCVAKKQEYADAGLAEYWIFDRFRRTLTVVRYGSGAADEIVVAENQTYESPLLPGFVVPLARILASADVRAGRTP